mgnify:CR=1 FL=1
MFLLKLKNHTLKFQKKSKYFKIITNSIKTITLLLILGWMDYDCMYRNMIAGGISGIFEVTTTHPVDLLKTKMQQNSKSFEIGNPLQWMKLYYSQNGIRGIYSGYIPRIIGIVPLRVVFWSSQELSNEYLKPLISRDEYRYLLAGVIAGTTQSMLDVPIENLKVRMMTSDTNFLSKTKNLYAGFYPNLYRNIGFTVFLNCFIHINNDHESPVEDFFRAATGAMVGSIVTQPLDYIKTQLQLVNPKYKNSKEVIVETWKVSPIHFYTGTFSRSFMGFLNMGIGYCVFNQVQKHFKTN